MPRDELADTVVRTWGAAGAGRPAASDRAVAWGFAVCVLSEVWDADGGTGWPGPGPALAVARRLAPLVAE
ncbi:hypothetical protein GCM10009772_48610 [Pseudonocardia alni subsp. carboxydivorans]|uniref:MftR C-terminal domain-containing protein n=1 Tax=Pseudonocardia alni subsp. carboxydivorans TaxID=415010 RepID=A0ABU9AAJ7_PSEA5